MTRIKNTAEYTRLDTLLTNFQTQHYSLPGIANNQAKKVFICQIIDSQRRAEYLEKVSIRSNSAALHTPYSGVFDALKGAASLFNQGNREEAFWLTFLATHFSRHKIDKWNLVEDVYGALGGGPIWSWGVVSQNPNGIRQWLEANHIQIKNNGRSRRFGNHRKYESLKPGNNGTGAILEAYIIWVMRDGGHLAKIQNIQAQTGQNPEDVFSLLYQSLSDIPRFGRLAKFDFLCNLSNLRFAPITPNRAYIEEASGPKLGAKRIFSPAAAITGNELDRKCSELGAFLSVNAQVVEDSLCNWNKSPTSYVYFSG